MPNEEEPVSPPEHVRADKPAPDQSGNGSAPANCWALLCVCARWDMRWVVVLAQTKADAHAIATAAVAAAVGAVMLPWCIVRALLRWPCKPLYWLWAVWRMPDQVRRIAQVLPKAPNHVISDK